MLGLGRDGSRLDVDNVTEDERGEKGAGEAGHEERDAGHAAS
jgi:hypothetical protein